jgi:hypothetical protein
MKFIYIVDHYVPFPSSEYGGVWNVVAENDEECFDLITEEDGYYSQYFSELRQNINKADKYSLLDELPSKVVTSFLT